MEAAADCPVLAAGPHPPALQCLSKMRVKSLNAGWRLLPHHTGPINSRTRTRPATMSKQTDWVHPPAQTHCASSALLCYLSLIPWPAQ